jgi:hypothetical protein
MDKSFLRSILMSNKKAATDRLKNTLSELDNAIEQWDSLTNKPIGEQAPSEDLLQKKTQELLKELREQIQEFDTHTPPPPSNKDSESQELHSN